MIVDHRAYTLLPGMARTFVKRYEEEGLAIQRPILGNLVGYYFTEVGPLNQVIHLWAFETFEERIRRRAELNANAAWQAYLAKTRPLIVSQQNMILNPAPFSPDPRLLAT